MRRDPARAVTAGIASVAALLVAGGLALQLVGALDTTGWVVVVAVLAAGALVAARDPARHAVPALIATAALGLAIGAVALSRASALDRESETRFTQLWILPDGTGRSAEVGVRNEEGGRAAFRVAVYQPASRPGPPLVDETIVLEPGRSWSRRVAIPATPLPERVNVELFRAGRSEPHRSAHAWTSP
jgi:hypothetical protein